MFYNLKYDHTDPNLLKIHNIIALQTIQFVFRSLNYYSINCGFQLLHHNIGIRGSMDLRIPLCRATHAQQSVTVRGAKLWKMLPQYLRSMLSQISFKADVKNKLLETYGINM